MVETVKQVGRALNNLDTTYLEEVFAEDIIYNSQKVLADMRGKRKVIDFLAAKFKTIKKSGSSDIFAELAFLSGIEPYLKISQGQIEQIVGHILLQIEEGKVKRYDICFIPHHSEAVGIGEFPR